jgi:hypothetical protein
MRIKLFESFNDYYQEITVWEFLELREQDNKEEFTSRERDLINETDLVDYWYEKDESIIPKVRLEINSNYIYIWKLEDGYFLVKSIGGDRRMGTIYKCDQIEGVMKLLKSKGLL